MNIREAGKVLELREQLQEDVRTFMLAFPAGYDDGTVRASADYITDSLCDLVTANFRTSQELYKKD